MYAFHNMWRSSRFKDDKNSSFCRVYEANVRQDLSAKTKLYIKIKSSLENIPHTNATKMQIW